MTTQEYIESGLLEAYVLGALSQEEMAQVHADIQANPDLAKEVADLEDTLLGMAAAGAMQPPAGLDDKIWAAINPAEQKPQTVAEPKSFTAANKTIPLTAPERKTDWRYAAAVVALLGSAALNGVFWLQNSGQKQQLAEQTARINKMDTQQTQLVATLENYRKRAEMMADTGMQTIVMHTIVKGHPMAATLYWSKTKGEAYVMLDALPVPPKGMQYQLWAIQDGKPVDMGVLPMDMPGTSNMSKVSKAVMAGEAFAISLEKEGGSPVPTAENIYVLGKS